MDKIICLGKNYLDHAKEMGGAVPEKPVVFLKPPSVLREVEKNGDTLHLTLPSGRGEIHHECEIVLRVQSGGIAAVTLGLDMTLRDEQARLKQAGHPWTTSKVFTDSAVVGPWVSSEFLAKPFSFSVGGVVRQAGSASSMRLSPTDCLHFVATLFPLCDGDLIFTGTPAGVGAIQPGDVAVLKWAELSYSVMWSTAPHVPNQKINASVKP